MLTFISFSEMKPPTQIIMSMIIMQVVSMVQSQDMAEMIGPHPKGIQPNPHQSNENLALLQDFYGKYVWFRIIDTWLTCPELSIIVLHRFLFK